MWCVISYYLGSYKFVKIIPEVQREIEIDLEMILWLTYKKVIRRNTDHNYRIKLFHMHIYKNNEHDKI